MCGKELLVGIEFGTLKPYMFGKQTDQSELNLLQSRSGLTSFVSFCSLLVVIAEVEFEQLTLLISSVVKFWFWTIEQSSELLLVSIPESKDVILQLNVH